MSQDIDRINELAEEAQTRLLNFANSFSDPFDGTLLDALQTNIDALRDAALASAAVPVPPAERMSWTITTAADGSVLCDGEPAVVRLGRAATMLRALGDARVAPALDEINMAFVALTTAQEPAQPVATVQRGGSDVFGRATVLVRWEGGERDDEAEFPGASLSRRTPDFIERARAAVLDAAQADPVPGMVLVPVKPTQAMLDAAAATPGVKAIDAAAQIHQLREHPHYRRADHHQRWTAMSKNTNPMPHVEHPNPFLAVDEIEDNFNLVPPSKPNVWVLPAILAAAVVVAVYAALFWATSP